MKAESHQKLSGSPSSVQTIVTSTQSFSVRQHTQSSHHFFTLMRSSLVASVTVLDTKIGGVTARLKRPEMPWTHGTALASHKVGTAIQTPDAGAHRMGPKPSTSDRTSALTESGMACLMRAVNIARDRQVRRLNSLVAILKAEDWSKQDIDEAIFTWGRYETDKRLEG